MVTYIKTFNKVSGGHPSQIYFSTDRHYRHICQAIDNNQYACMVFLDVSKAFDRVWHKGLIFKLRQYGIDGDLLTWITDYLDDRKQRVVIKSCMSTFKNVKAGVPQGSVLGPLLFLIFVNDISSSLLSLTRLFADDSSLFCSASNLEDIEGIINHDLSARRYNHKLCFMYKAENGQVPSYISDIIPPLVRQTTNYPLRNQNDITTHGVKQNYIEILVFHLLCQFGII